MDSITFSVEPLSERLNLLVSTPHSNVQSLSPTVRLFESVTKIPFKWAFLSSNKKLSNWCCT